MNSTCIMNICIMRKNLLSAAAMLCLMAAWRPLLADFDSRGRVDATIGQDRIFADEDFALVPHGGDKPLDVIDWRCTGVRSPLDHSVTLTGVEGKFKVRTSVSEVDDGFRITYDFTVDAALAAGNCLAVSLKIPKALFSFVPADGARTIAEFGADGKAQVAGLYRYEFDTAGSDVAIKSGTVIDFRGVGWYDDFRLDLRTAQLTSPSVRVVLKATRAFDPQVDSDDANSPFFMLPLADAFTRPLADEVENDGKGGWTDQGTNDMSCLAPGVIRAQGIPFEIGEGAIILWGRWRPSFPRQSKVIEVNEKVERLAFCHTAAWCNPMVPGFFYRIVYADGTQVEVPVHGGLDVADWVGGLPVTARVRCAWKGTNSEHAVNLAHFQWKNPHPELAVKSVQVVSANVDTVAIVLAITAIRQEHADDMLITALNQEYAKSEDDTMTLAADKPDWYDGGIDASQMIEPGSALDVSFVLHKPAGKYGFVKRVGDHFEFEQRPGERIAFWGTNIGTAGPRREFVPAIVDRLAKSGINIVRIHYWMLQFQHPECKVESERSFIRRDGTVDMQRLDDFYYFFAELKKNGIYVYMDAISSGNDWLPGGEELHYRPDANARIKEIVKLMYTTVNPYTGLALVDDPAFAMCEIHNEHSATYHGTVQTHSPQARKLMKQWWEEWQDEHKLSPRVELTGTPTDGNGEEGRRFYTSIQQRFLEEWHDYLRRLGVKVPISGTNVLLTTGDLIASQNMDFMEEHAYYGAGPIPGGLWQPNNTSSVNEPLRGNSMIGEIIHSRVADKPIACTEWSYVYPHQYREEGYPYVSAFSAYQQFDAMFSFDWSGAYVDNISSVLNKKPIVCLSQISDPSSWGLNLVAAVAFLRGDVMPAKNRVLLKYTWEDIWQNRRQHPLGVAYLLQMARVAIQRPDANTKGPSWPYGTGMTGDELFRDAVQRLGIDAGRDYIISDTGELKRFAEPGLFLLDTPRSQFATGALNSMGGGQHRTLSAFGVFSPMKFATITFTSLDNEPLESSSRILMCAVGNSANSTSSIDASGYHEAGKLPVLSEPVYATITANAVPGKQLKVYRLDPSTGRRLGQLAVTANDGKESFTMDKDTKTMYLELIRE